MPETRLESFVNNYNSSISSRSSHGTNCSSICGVMVGSSKREIGESSSNSNKVRYIYFRANTLGKRITPILLPARYG